MAKGKYEQWRTPEGLTLLRGWAREGLTDEQLAKRIGVRRQTIYEWSARFPDIADALKKGREVIDLEVEETLLRRALGYDYVERREESHDEDGVRVVDRVVETVKHVPPDTGAAAIWLKNRMRERWRHKWPELPAPEETERRGCILLPEVELAAEDGEAADDGG